MSVTRGWTRASATRKAQSMATNEATGMIGASIDDVLRPRRHWTRGLWSTVRQNPLGTMGFLIIFAPLIAPYDIDEFRDAPPAPSGQRSLLYLQGGRDPDSPCRVVFGARISL